MKKSANSLIPIGLMLFALFFGAGNLIFPVFMGQSSGVNTIPATIGFLVTGVGLPILGVAAIGYSGNDLQALASRIHQVCHFLHRGPVPYHRAGLCHSPYGHHIL